MIKRVEVLEALDKARGAVIPIGVIQAFYGKEDKIPDGWLLCDGRPIPNDCTELRELCENNRTPDLGGVFLRGIDYGDKHDTRDEQEHLYNDQRRSRDPEIERTIGSLQAQSYKKHTHNIGYGDTAIGKALGDITNGSSNNVLASPYMYGYEGRYYQHSDDDTYKALESGENETRPINIAVNYIIKAK